MEFNRKQKFKVTTLSIFKNKVIDRFKDFVFKEIIPSGQFFFLLFAINYFRVLDINPQTHDFIFVLGLIVMAIFNCNLYFYYILVLKLSNIYLQFVSLFLGICSCNDEYKIYILVYTFSFHFTNQENQTFILFIKVISAAILCYQIYQHLIFKSVNENIKYFIGFSVLETLNLILYLKVIIDVQFTIIFEINIVILTFLISYIFINKRIEEIKYKSCEELLDPRIAYFKIALHEDNVQLCIHFIKNHMEACEDPQCFCVPYANKIDSLTKAQKQNLCAKVVNYLYLNIFSEHQERFTSHNFLYSEYSLFLLRKGNTIQGLRIIQNADERDLEYFSKTQYYRIWKKFGEHLGDINYFLRLRKKYEQVYFYDERAGYLKKEINEIITQKIAFWNEVGVIAPQVKKLEQCGVNIIDKMENLDEFFNDNIYPIEEQLLNFQYTLLYASYLFLTTNYSDMAILLFKKVQSLMGQIAIGTPREVSGLTAILQNEIQANNSIFNFLTISSVSKNFAKIVRKTKEELLNQNIQIIIPKHYEDSHLSTFDRFIKANKKIDRKSSVLYTQVEVPFKINDQFVIFYKLNVRLHVNVITSTFCFQALVYQTENHEMNCLMNLKGQIKYRQINSNVAIFKSTQLMKIIAELRERYENTGSTEEYDADLQLSEGIMHFNFSFYFEPALKRIGKEPLMRVRFQNENSRYQAVNKNEIIPVASAKKCDNTKEISDSDSQSSISSRKDALENIVLIVQQNNWSKKQAPLVIFFIFVLIVTIAMLLIIYNVFTINQNIESLKSYAVFFNTMTYPTNAMSLQQDLKLYDTGETEYTQYLDSLPPNGHYRDWTYQKLKKLGIDLKEQIYTSMYGKQNYINKFRKQHSAKKIPITYYSAEGTPSGQMKLQDLVSNVVVEIKYLKNYEFNKTQLGNIFMPKVLPNLRNMRYQIDELINTNLEDNYRNNIILTCCSIFAIILLLIPYIKILAVIKNNSLGIFNLIVSINSSIISKQISKLEDIRDKLFNHHNQDKGIFNSIQGKEKSQQCIANNIVPQIFNKVHLNSLDKHQSNPNKNFRTRPGQLDIQGSTLNKNKFSLYQSLFFVILLVVIGEIVSIFLVKKEIFEFLKETKYELEFNLEEVKIDGFQLYYAKMYFDQYGPNNKIEFLETDIDEWLQQSMKHQYSIENDRPNGLEEAEIQTCMDKKLVCSQNYSYTILRGVIKKGIFDSYKVRHQLLRDINSPKLLMINPKHIRQQLFVAQEAYEKILELSSNFKQSIFKKQTQYEKMSLIRFQIMLYVFISMQILFLIFFIVFCLINRSKYRKFVIFLSFLSKEMVYRNKMVESFVERLFRDLR